MSDTSVQGCLVFFTAVSDVHVSYFNRFKAAPRGTRITDIIWHRNHILIFMNKQKKVSSTKILFTKVSK